MTDLLFLGFPFLYVFLSTQVNMFAFYLQVI